MENKKHWIVLVVLSFGGLAGSSVAAADRVGSGATPLPEWLIKIHEIATRDPMRPQDSPLIRSKSRYSWESLAQNHGIPSNGVIPAKNYQGTAQGFARLDRDGDGVLRASDFDWSDRSPFVREQAVAASLFQWLNQDGDGFIDWNEWKKGWEKSAGEAKKLTQDDLRRLMFAQGSRSTVPPTRLMRLLGFFSGELGSMNEGPNPGELAPDFTLNTQDNLKTIRLSQYRNHKPVVLIFGNFT